MEGPSVQHTQDDSDPGLIRRAGPPSLLIITIDCMRADYLSSDITPQLHALGSSSTVYSRAYANGCGTPDSFPAIMASRLAGPWAHRPDIGPDVAYSLTPNDMPIAEVLQGSGYDTGAFVAGNPYLGRAYGYHRGFQDFRDNQPGSLINKFTGRRLRGALRKMAPRLPWSPYPKAELVTQSCVDWLMRRFTDDNEPTSRPFFVWVHYMDAHFPTLPPGRWSLQERAAAWSPVRGDAGKHQALLKRLYSAALSYVDAQIGLLLSYVPRETVVAVTADHGQLFGEHGSYHHNGVWDELLLVPLIIRSVDQKPSSIAGAVQLLDLAPNLLNLMGISPPEVWQGHMLTTPVEGIYAVSNSPPQKSYSEAWIYQDRKVISTPESKWEFPLGQEPDVLNPQDASKKR